MSRLYVYVVDRDFGFAPNPFHGFCTLATCKPRIRSTANNGDWVVGVGGSRLNATGKCIYAMRVSKIMSFNEYWNDKACAVKKPIRTGSRLMLVGDNIYRQDSVTSKWQQADSHHSNHDGTINVHNLQIDTQANRVLLSNHFWYFGKSAPAIPQSILQALTYSNGRNYRVYPLQDAASFIDWIETKHPESVNFLSGDPFDFDQSEKRYSAGTNKVS